MIRRRRQRRLAATLPGWNGRLFGLTIFLAAIFPAAPVCAQFSSAYAVRSLSGQFIVSSASGFSPLIRQPDLATNAAILRFVPSLLAVSAERFKTLLWQQLGLGSGSPWNGEIFLALHPARSPDDDITITATPFQKTWSFRVDLPDVVARPRFARALAGVLLLEIACRHTAAAGHPMEIPPWLADGLAQQVLAADGGEIFLNAPAKKVNGIAASRFNGEKHPARPFAAAHRTLQNFSALTFDQLSWPDDPQLNGEDGGAYLASAQLFVNSLLALNRGADKMRDLLAQLPACYNWQTAFFTAFHDDFKRPLDVEKWWALRVVAFATRDPGALWSPMDSRDRLAALVSVPVQFRSGSNSLPAAAEISLQDAIRNFEPALRETILEIKLRDLELARLRLASPFSALADGYAAALAELLGESKKIKSASAPAGKHGSAARRTADFSLTLKKLDALDARRRTAEANVRPVLAPLILTPAVP